MSSQKDRIPPLNNQAATKSKAKRQITPDPSRSDESYKLLEERFRAQTRELEEAKQQILETRDMFFTLFHANPIPTSLMRMEDGLFIDANDAYLAYYNSERESVIGRTSAELHLPLDPSIRPQLIERLRNEGILQNIELNIRHPSGESRTILASLQHTSAEETEALILAFIDITDRVKAELQIRSLASDLTIAEQEERRRISQILHDDLQQRIFAVKMQLTTLYDAYRKNDLASARLSPCSTAGLRSLLRLRVIAIDSSSHSWSCSKSTSADALNWLCEQMYDQYGMDLNVETNGVNIWFEDTLRILLFQAVREALFNVVKHANTLQATVRLEDINGFTRITVSDKGSGFLAQTVEGETKEAGGLRNLRHRLSLMGCSLRIQSEPSNGTEMTVDVPRKR